MKSKRYTVRKNAMCDFMIRDNARGWCFGSFGLKADAQKEADRLNSAKSN